MSDELVGKVIGKYQILERIGRGGMAEVYKGHQSSLDRFVALKILHPFLGEDPEFKERFEREARNVAQLRHPNIVQVYDFEFDSTRDIYYMVMEYIGGPTLRSKLLELSFQQKSFTLQEATNIIIDLAEALSYAHGRGMVHRDIKPANIMLDDDGRVILTDFGIARIITGPQMTASGSMVGTPAYMSPEQGLGQSGDHRSDIYSLGVVLYQLVTGTIPYDADTPIAIVLKHVNDPLPPPSTINPGIPETLERILYKALEKSPEERYQTVDEFSHDLENFDSPSTLILHADSASRPKAKQKKNATPTPAVTTYTQPAQTGCLGFLGVSILSLLALIGGFYATVNSIVALPGAELSIEQRLTSSASDSMTFQASLPTFTPEVLEPSPDEPQALATEFSLTIAALEQQDNRPENTPTPDMTATFIACDYDYEIVSQEPATKAPYPEVTSLTKRIVIINDSNCRIDDDTRLVFLEGQQLEGPNFVEFNQELLPGDEFEIILELETPPYNPESPIIESTWIVQLPDGKQIGPPLTFEITIFEP